MKTLTGIDSCPLKQGVLQKSSERGDTATEIRFSYS